MYSKARCRKPPRETTRSGFCLLRSSNPIPTANFRVEAPVNEFERIEMNEPELTRSAESTGGKFYTPLTADALFKDLPKPSKVPLDTDPPDPALEHLAHPHALPSAAHDGVGFQETPTNGIRLVRTRCRTAISGCRFAQISRSFYTPAEGGWSTWRPVREGLMTPVQLESRIAALRSSVRRLLALHGLSRVLGLIVPLVILAGIADWLFHLDGVIRAALLLSLIGGALWLCYRYVLRPLFVRFADLDIAMRIEERWPGLNDRLASTIQFFHVDADDDRYGSPALREATMRQAVEEASAIDFREVIEPKPVLRALGLASAATHCWCRCWCWSPRDRRGSQ